MKNKLVKKLKERFGEGGEEEEDDDEEDEEEEQVQAPLAITQGQGEDDGAHKEVFEVEEAKEAPKLSKKKRKSKDPIVEKPKKKVVKLSQ